MNQSRLASLEAGNAQSDSAAFNRVSTYELRKWVGKGFWALTDQGLFTVSNLVLHVLLARWLTPQEYGAFSVGFAIFLLLGAFHIALFGEPMLVYGPHKYKDCLPDYLGVLVYEHLKFTALGCFMLFVLSLALWLGESRTLSATLLVFAFWAPCILSLWLFRSMYYLHLQQLSRAAQGGGLYLGLMSGGIYLLSHYQWLSAASGIGVMGVASLVAGAWLALHLPIGRIPFRSCDLVREVWMRHWNYGRWSMATYVLIWIPENVYYLFLPRWNGLEASAALRASMNLLMPLFRTYAALTPLLVSAFVRVQEEARSRTVRFLLWGFTGSSVLYGIFLFLFHQPLMSWLYKGQYGEYRGSFWLLGLLPLCAGATTVLSGILRALGRPDRLFWAYAFSSTAALTLGVGLTAVWGVKGAIIGLWLSGITGTVAMGIFYRPGERLRAL